MTSIANMVPAIPGDSSSKKPIVRWWESWWYACVLILLSIIPLIWPSTPPLPDLPGHMARYVVQLNLDHSKLLQQFFDFQWALIGNLGVDLLIIPMSKLFGLEIGVKILVLTIPALTTAALLWITCEVHGKLQPTSGFAVPFVYGFPFAHGFVNFSLSAGLALLAFAYWLHLTRYARYSLRIIAFVPISCLIWLTHVFGWGLLGLLVSASECVRIGEKKENWRTALKYLTKAVLPLAAPISLMIIWRHGMNGATYTGGFFDPIAKSYSLIGVLRDRWLIWDCISLAAVLVALWATYRQQEIGYSNRLLIPSTVIGLMFLILPSYVFGSAYTDARIAPFIFITLIIAARCNENSVRGNAMFAALAALFVVLRLGGNTLSYYIADAEAKEQLTPLEYFEPGVRVLSLTGNACPREWQLPRYLHLGSFVIIRRHGFSNDQWQTAGAQLLSVKYLQAKPFEADPSTFVYTQDCIQNAMLHEKNGEPAGRTIDDAIRIFPRKAFDFVWILKPPGPFSPSNDMALVWRGRDSALYRVLGSSRKTVRASF